MHTPTHYATSLLIALSWAVIFGFLLELIIILLVLSLGELRQEG